MAFSQCDRIDIEASHSTFNNVGGDQLQTFEFLISHAAVVNIFQGHRDTGRQNQNSQLRISQEGFTTNHLSTVVSEVDNAFGLLIDIIRLLRRESLDDTRYLERQLKSLSQTISFTRFALEAYEFTPLGRSLAKAVHPNVRRCNGLLQEITKDIIRCRENLRETSIFSLWGRVWWSSLDIGEWNPLWRSQVSACHRSLQEFLMALNSYVSFLCVDGLLTTSSS